MIARHRLQQLGWIPALAPLILLVGAGIVLLLARWLDSGGGHTAHDDSAAFRGALFVFRLLFIFALYLAAPLWCVLALYPSLRPSPATLFGQILLFIGGWFFFFAFAGNAVDMERFILGAF